DLIGRFVAPALSAPGRPPGPAGLILAALALDLHLGLGGGLLGAFVLAGLTLLAFHGRDRFGLVGFAALALLALRLLLLAAFGLRFILGRLGLVEAKVDVEIRQELSHRAGEGALVADQLR